MIRFKPIKEKVLTEDEFDMFDDNIDEIGDELKQNIQNQSNQEPQQDDNNNSQFLDRDFGKEYLDAKDINKDKVIDEFIKEFMSYNKIDVSSFRNALHYQLSLMGARGLSQTTNPYLIFIVKLGKIDNTILKAINDTAYNNIINLVSDSIINESILINVNSSSILVVKDLYSKAYLEMKYYCQCFYYLTNYSNSSILRERLIELYKDKKSIEEFSSILGTKGIPAIFKYNENTGEIITSNLDDSNFYRFILFENGDNLNNNIIDERLRPAKKIQNALSFLDTFAANEGTLEDSDDSELEDIKYGTPSDKSVKLFSEKGLDKINADIAKDLINQLLKKYKINI